MRPLAQATGNLLTYDEMPTEKELEDPEGPCFEFNDPAAWGDIDPEMTEAFLKTREEKEGQAGYQEVRNGKKTVRWMAQIKNHLTTTGNSVLLR
jgi:hypothetical protein